LNKPQDERLAFEQVLIDALTEGVPEEAIQEEHVAILERQEDMPEVEEFDLRLENMADILPLSSQEHIIRLTRSIYERREELDNIIHRYAPDYPVETLAVVDRNILRLAIYEFGVSQETPLSVAVNEAVELAKLFGAESTPRFMNGVLGALGRSHDKILLELAEQEKQKSGS
jgi:N utilization substance protein B